MSASRAHSARARYFVGAGGFCRSKNPRTGASPAARRGGYMDVPADILAGARMHGAAARRGGYMDVPADILAGARMHGAAARRGGYMDVPADILAGARMHGAAARRGGYMDVHADILAGARMHGAAARRGGYMDVPADIPACNGPARREPKQGSPIGIVPCASAPRPPSGLATYIPQRRANFVV